MNRRTFLAGSAGALILAGCGGPWRVAYDGVPGDVSRAWRLHDVIVTVPDSLTLSEANTLAPDADIVWHGEPRGDRRAQVRAILDEGITRGASGLRGARRVDILVVLRQFHAVTPLAVSKAPTAVHNIKYAIQVRDAATRQPLTEAEVVSADLEAFTGIAAVTAAIEGQTQRVRIVDHLAAVTRGWLGLGPDQRGTFSALGR